MSTAVAGKPGLDPALPDVPVILGGVERTLCFDYNAIVVAEKATGINLLKGMVSEVSATSLRGLLWAALLRDSPEMTVEEAGALITPRNVKAIHYALNRAWFHSVRADEENKPAGEAEAQPVATV
jgi:hypothetical protein